MATWSQNVYSEMASSIGYDDTTQDLLVTWKKSGKVSAYSGVPEELALQVANAPSVGRMLDAEIKNSYPHRYL